MPLLSPAALTRLERLRLISRRSLSAGSAGDRRSASLGSSAEFADHRNYHLGDDPRYIDWNAFARMERLFIKLFQQDVEVTVHLIVDASASMGFGSPTKLDLAKRVAAGLSYVALSNLDRAGLLVLDGRGDGAVPPGRGRAWQRRLDSRLEAAVPSGRPDPGDALARYAARQKRRGLAIVISDFLDPRFPDALKPLLQSRHELWCLQTLCPEDLGEGLGGDLRLVDSETGEAREISVTREVQAAYAAQVLEFRDGLERWCLGRGAGYAYVDSGADFEDMLVRVLRRRRLVR